MACRPERGVPLLLVVIHNAIDAQPKGDDTYYPCTVEVDVLPPVSTGAWTYDTSSRSREPARATGRSHASRSTLPRSFVAKR